MRSPFATLRRFAEPSVVSHPDKSFTELRRTTGPSVPAHPIGLRLGQMVAQMLVIDSLEAIEGKGRARALT